MDWKDTDPTSLNTNVGGLTLHTQETEETARLAAIPFVPPVVEGFAPSHPLPIWNDMAVPSTSAPASLLHAPHSQQIEVSLQAPGHAVSVSQQAHSAGWKQQASSIPASVWMQGSQTEGVNAVIWQKLSRLVHAPSRSNGLWPLLTPAAVIGMFVALGSGNGWMLLTWSLLLAASLKINNAHIVKEQAREAIGLAPYDLRWVGPLTQAIHSPHPRVQGVSAQILTHLLPYLRLEDTSLLNIQQRLYLNQRLFRNRKSDSDLNISILAAWETVGDREAVPYVERLAHSWAWSVPQRRVREAAMQCLPRLEKRLEDERAAQVQQQRIQAGETSGPTENVELSSGARTVNARVSEQLAKLEEERKKHSNPGMRLGFLIASWTCIVPYTASMMIATFRENWKLSAAWAVLTVLATQLYRFTLSMKQTEEARKLAETDDVRAVGSLAEALEWPDAYTQRIASQALARLLPRLNASDGNLLNAKQRAILYNMLRMRHVHAHESLIRGILEAMRQVGDEAAIPAVDRLANGRALSHRQMTIRALAKDTRPYLEEAARNQSATATLLRASSAHDTPSELLLRGAMAREEDAPQQLLRASVSSEEGG